MRGIWLLPDRHTEVPPRTFSCSRANSPSSQCAAETYDLSRSRKRTVDNISDGLLTESLLRQAESMQQVSPA